jgi:hypothetical protein
MHELSPRFRIPRLEAAAKLLLAWLLLGMCTTQAMAQLSVGRCFDTTRGQAFTVYENLAIVQDGFAFSQSYAARDASGLNFLMLPSVNPYLMAFYVDWQGSVIEINPNGYFRIGYCQFSNAFIPPRPYPDYQAPELANWGIRAGDNVVALPDAIAVSAQRYTAPLLATPATAESCLVENSITENDDSGNTVVTLDESGFGSCMLDSMLGTREKDIYHCTMDSPSGAELAFCVVGAIGGEEERRITNQLNNCYSEHGSQWNEYPVCLLEENIDSDSAKLLNCVMEQADTGSVDLFGTAVCFGVEKLNMNPEAQIAMQCAMMSGGEPFTFAGCAGGELTLRELNKCVETGIGGDGCFGPNNDIVRALSDIGIDLNRQLGPNNDLVRAWNNGVNDLRDGPGANNDLLQVANTIANDLSNGPGPNNDIVQAVDQVLPGFSSLFGD